MSKVEGDLSLGELTSITDQQAESLGEVKYLRLNGLTSISDKQAESLSKVKFLMLNGLTSITDAQAEMLSKIEGTLYLNGLTTITDAQAETLSRIKGLHLSDSCFEQILSYQQKILDKINVSGTIDDGQITILKSYKGGDLVLSGLRTITDNQIDALSEIPSLNLSGLVSITDHQVEILSKPVSYTHLTLPTKRIV